VHILTFPVHSCAYENRATFNAVNFLIVSFQIALSSELLKRRTGIIMLLHFYIIIWVRNRRFSARWILHANVQHSSALRDGHDLSLLLRLDLQLNAQFTWVDFCSVISWLSRTYLFPTEMVLCFKIIKEIKQTASFVGCMLFYSIFKIHRKIRFWSKEL
jgi:hypothetical protein